MSGNNGHKRSWQRGFTMVELALALVILFLLVAITVASIYDHQDQKAKRQAINRLMEVAEWMKMQHGIQPNYSTMLPQDWTTHVKDADYRISLARAPVPASDPKGVFPALGTDTFTLQAVPATQSDCGTLLLDQTGRRGVTGEGARVDACWE